MGSYRKGFRDQRSEGFSKMMVHKQLSTLFYFMILLMKNSKSEEVASTTMAADTEGIQQMKETDTKSTTIAPKVETDMGSKVEINTVEQQTKMLQAEKHEETEEKKDEKSGNVSISSFSWGRMVLMYALIVYSVKNTSNSV